MKTYLLLAAGTLLLCSGGCQLEETNPDYSGLPNVAYDVQQEMGSTGNNEPQVSVNPNPFFIEFTVSLYAPSPTLASVYLTDEKGKYRKEIETNVTGYTTVRVNFDSMPKGVYLCEVHQAGQVSRYRMIKAR